MGNDLHDRWLATLAALRQELSAKGENPNAIEADETRLKLALPLEGTEFFTHQFSKSELQHGEPAALAGKLYADYQAHRTR